MRDFPVFPTDFGVAGLVLREIPYRETAYITVHEALPGCLPELLKECVSFCRMAGAERIYVKGRESFSGYPLYCKVLQMSGTAWVDKAQLEHLFPVTAETVTQWRNIYNEKMRQVDNAATLESRDEKKILESNGAYFVHHDGKLLGIGWLEDACLLAVAAVEPGSGQRVMHTLMSLVEGSRMTIEVASTNSRAIHLYEKLGFLVTGEVSSWHQIPRDL